MFANFNMNVTEACNIKKLDIRSLDFTVTRYLMKIHKFSNISVIQECIFLTSRWPLHY